ncbi:histidine kinase [Alcaligenaceae bacterium]|nr:histidine kinase [Alcaligenaceae bacterium]
MNVRPISQELSPDDASFGFWRAQLMVWIILAFIGFFSRLAIFGNVMAAFWPTVAQEPLAFVLTSAAAIVHGRYWPKKIPFILTFVFSVLLCLIASALLASIGFFINQSFPPEAVRILPGNQFRLGFIYYMGVFSIWTLMYIGIGAELAARNERISKMKAETRAVQLELEHLQRQVEPHFLFNALNAVVAEIGERPAIAEEMTRRLADYLRYSLDKRGHGTCRVDEEIEAAEAYIRIQALRFDQKLEYQCQVDPNALDFHLPHMTLQGLVENAIKHGMQATSACFLINISVRCKGDEVIIEVENPGHLYAPGGAARGGGLNNLCRRLALFYPDRHEFSLSQRAGRTVAQIRLRGGPVVSVTY